MVEMLERKIKCKPGFLWDSPGFPRRGWLHHYIIDNETHDNICDVCGRDDLRYHHILSHHLWDGEIQSGCICAGVLTGSVNKAKEHEKQFKSNVKRRENWIDDPGWKLSRKGNHYIEYVHKLTGVKTFITVYSSYKGDWTFRANVDEPQEKITEHTNPKVKFFWSDYRSFEYVHDKWYSDIKEAKLASFDAIFMQQLYRGLKQDVS